MNQYQDLSRFKVQPGFRGRSGVVVLCWQIIHDTLFAWSPQPAYLWRRLILRAFGAKVGRGVFVRPSARITYPWKVSLGDHCWIGDHAELYSLDMITIGAHAVVSQKSYLCAGTHDAAGLTFPLVGKPITVENEAWIATDCFIAPGITIGYGSIIGARSCVFVDIPAGVVAVGYPAKVVKPRHPSN